MTTAEDIANYYELTPSGESFTGYCPCCGYRGFSLTEKKDGQVLFYCHGGGCAQVQIIDVLRQAGLWGTSSAGDVFEFLEDDVPKSDPQLEHESPEDSTSAMAMWQRSQPAAGTVVESYLRARGYRGAIPVSLRYATGKHRSDGAMHPVMVAAVIRSDRPPGIIGVHRTFLSAEGTGKATLEPNKMSLGPVRGGAVPLAVPSTDIAVSEGIETGLSFMQAIAIPTWAALSAGGMKRLLLPLEARTC